MGPILLFFTNKPWIYNLQEVGLPHTSRLKSMHEILDNNILVDFH